MKSNILMKSALAALLVFGTSVHALAQGPEARTAEVSVGGGYAYLNTGDSTTVGKKHHGAFDAQLSYNIVKKFSLGFEYSLVPLDKATYGSVTATEKLHNFGGVARIGFFDKGHVMPYAVVSGGGLSLRDSATSGSASVTVSQSGGYVGFGGGLNGYLGHGFGIRPEFRYQYEHLSSTTINGVSVNGSGRHAALLTASLFYTFGHHGK